MGKDKQDPSSFEEVLENYVRKALVGSSALPQIEFCTFSGAASDWKKDGNAIFLRLQRSGVVDEAGNPHELWARLFCPAGIFIIPTVATEMLVIVPPEAEGAGVGWAFYGAQLPPQAVSQTVARWDIDKNTTLCAWAGGWAFRGGPGGSTFVSIDTPTGDAQISTLSGHHIALSNSHDSIELQITDKATPASNPLSTIRMDATGILLQTAQAGIFIGADGTIKTIGSGAITFAHPGGCFGPLPTMPVGTAGGGASSAWRMSG